MATHRVPAVYLSPRQVAERLGVLVPVVLNWIASGELRAANVAKKNGVRPRWKIAPADLELFLAARANRQPPPVRRQRMRPEPGEIQYFPTR